MSTKRKRNALDLDRKVKIIRDIENGKKQSVVCTEYCLLKSTVNTIWVDHDKICSAFKTTCCKMKKFHYSPLVNLNGHSVSKT